MDNSTVRSITYGMTKWAFFWKSCNNLI